MRRRHMPAPKLSLESEQEVAPTEIEPVAFKEGDLPDSIEYDIAKSDQEIALDVEETQAVSGVVEALENYKADIKQLIATETYSPQTARLLQIGVNHQLSMLAEGPTSISNETFTGKLTVKQQHEKLLVAVEGAVMNNIAQGYAMKYKKIWNNIGDFLRTSTSQIQKYRSKLDASVAEFNKKKPKLGNEKHTLRLVDLWQFFSNDKGPCTDLLSALEADLHLSKYILVEYTTGLTRMAKSVQTALSTANFSTVENAMKAAAAFERFPHPVEAFKKDLLGKTYLNATLLEISESKARQPVTAGGKSFDKLARLATPMKVVETGSGFHDLKKVASYVKNPLKKSVAGDDIQMTAAEIDKVFLYGKAYLDNCEQYLKLEKELMSHVSEMFKSLQKAEDTMTEETPKEAEAIFQQVFDFACALVFTNAASPGNAELSRSLKGAKYCMYLGHRMIYNAK